MKTLCKKLLSLMLAAVLLVSVVPFTAMAAEDIDAQGECPAPTSTIVSVKTFINGEEVATSKQITVPADGVVLNEELARKIVTIWDNRTFDKWGDSRPEADFDDVTGNTLSLSWLLDAEQEGYYLELYLTEKVEDTKPTTPPTTEPTTPPTTEPTTPPTTEPKPEVKTILFEDTRCNDGKIYSVEIKPGETLNVPSVDHETGWKFLGWYPNETGSLGSGKVDKYTKYEDVKDGAKYFARHEDVRERSTVHVFVERYVGKTLKETRELESIVLDKGENVFDWLYENKTNINNRIFSVFSADDYTWDRYLYDYSGKKELTQQNLEVNGTKSIVVKIQAKKEATVLVYVHKDLTSKELRVIELADYTKGDVVTKNAVKIAVEKYYNGTAQGLYSDEAWKDLKNGEKPTQAEGVSVKDNGTTKIHVLLKNASNSKPDSSNPKTGDSIMMTFTVMAVSVSALAVLVLLNKKRMVK